MAVGTQPAVWVDTLGLPVEPEVVFHPDTVDRFATEGCAHLAPGTRLDPEPNSGRWVRWIL